MNASDELAYRIGMYTIALRAVELDIAVRSAMRQDLSLQLARLVDLRAEIELCADKWLAENEATADRIYEGTGR